MIRKLGILSIFILIVCILVACNNHADMDLGVSIIEITSSENTETSTYYEIDSSNITEEAIESTTLSETVTSNDIKVSSNQSENEEKNISSSFSSLDIDVESEKISIKEDIMNTPISEDKSGLFYIGMEMDEFKEVARQNGVDFVFYSTDVESEEVTRIGSHAIHFWSGNLYKATFNSGNDKTSKTSKGILYGDSVNKMIEIYGDDYRYIPQEYEGAAEYYIYTFEGFTLKFGIDVIDDENELNVISWGYYII